MSQSDADIFMNALKACECSRDFKPLVSLFAQNAELENAARSVTRHGTQGAAEFWDDYLHSFRDIRSEFTDVSRADDLAVLEWVSEGALPDGTPIRYRGVSLLGFDEGKVSRFRTYYDSAAFLPEGAKRAEEAGRGASA